MALCLCLAGCDVKQTLSTLAPPASGATVAGVPYYLPRAYVPITLKGGPPPKDKDGNPTAAATYQVDITVGATTCLPDPGAPLFLAYDHSTWANDHFTLGVDQNGLLQTTSTSANDQSGAVALKAIEIVGEIAQAAVGLPTSRDLAVGGPGRAREPRAGPKCTIPPFATSIAFFPAQTATPIDTETQVPGQNKQVLTIKITPVAEEGMLGPQKLPLPYTGDADHPRSRQGVAFRRPVVRRYVIDVVPTPEAVTACGFGRQSSTYFATVPDTSADSVFWADMSRASLVKKDVKLSIANGMLTGVDVDNPSEVLAGVLLLSDALKEILSIPASVLSFKVQQIAAKEGYTDAQAKAIQSQIDLLTKQAALLKAQTAQ